MFRLFFPNHKWFFPSAVAWAGFLVAMWFEFVAATASAYTSNTVWLSRFLSLGYTMYFGYFAAGVAVFYFVWNRVAPGKWNKWAILGSGGIVMATNFSVQVSVVLNTWRGEFYNIVQHALTTPGSVTQVDLYAGIGQFLSLALMSMAVIVLNQFLIKHFVFRWRTTMSDYFISHWSEIRVTEGASQRIQEDTMRFASTAQSLASNLLEAVMVLISFMPLLTDLSSKITGIPLLGSIPYPLVFVAIVWSLFGTALLAIVGIKLPKLEFRNQAVEAALRKELVCGEDDPLRADPPTIAELFGAIRRNYFTLYAHFVYFDIARYLYLQIDAVFAILILIPTVVVGKITLGVFQQIVSAFTQVANSFQYLVNSWPTIIELLSIYARLKNFEKTIDNKFNQSQSA